jgi:hypothetical protein
MPLQNVCGSALEREGPPPFTNRSRASALPQCGLLGTGVPTTSSTSYRPIKLGDKDENTLNQKKRLIQ